MLQACQNQLRTGGTGAPFALDFGAVIMVAGAQGADVDLLTDVLPAAEAAILARFASDGDAGDEGEG